MVVSISRVVLEAIIADVRADPAVERCGLLLGEGRMVSASRSAPNIHPQPGWHFELDPAILIASERAARYGGGPNVLGHYHSHPSGQPVPSTADAAAAAADGRLWLIIGREGWRMWRSVGEQDQLASSQDALWLGRFCEELIEIVD